MKIIVASIGIKGGSGKSTASQLLAYGIAKLGHVAILTSTDVRRRERRIILDNKSYVNLDGRTTQGLTDSITKFKSYDEGAKLAVMILDGGANETRDLDKALASISDVVLIPFMRSHEDLDQAIIELEEHPKAFGLPTRWPYNRMALKKANRDMTERLASFGDRILNPNVECNASGDLLGDMDKVDTDAVNKASKLLAVQVLEKAGINPFTMVYPIGL